MAGPPSRTAAPFRHRSRGRGRPQEKEKKKDRKKERKSKKARKKEKKKEIKQRKKEFHIEHATRRATAKMEHTLTVPSIVRAISPSLLPLAMLLPARAHAEAFTIYTG